MKMDHELHVCRLAANGTFSQYGGKSQLAPTKGSEHGRESTLRSSLSRVFVIFPKLARDPYLYSPFESKMDLSNLPLFQIGLSNRAQTGVLYDFQNPAYQRPL